VKPVERNEILEIGEYEAIRDRFRKRVVGLKKARRVHLGEHMTALFENHDTVLFQIQEMLRTERITREDAIEHEIETYNELIPGRDELSATIFVEYPEPAERDRMLTALAGLESRFYLVVGDARLAVRNETRGQRSDRTTAVHYVKFPLGESAANAIRRGEAKVRLGVAHEAYRAEVGLTEAQVDELRADLA
jgi:hypothetical protein